MWHFFLKTKICDLSDLFKVYKCIRVFDPGKDVLAVCCIAVSFPHCAIKFSLLLLQKKRSYIPIYRFIKFIPTPHPTVPWGESFGISHFGFLSYVSILRLCVLCAYATASLLDPVIYGLTKDGQSFQKEGMAFTRGH